MPAREILFIPLLLSLGCKALPEADPELSTALVQALRNFDLPDEDMAPSLRAIERQLYLRLELDSRDEAKRAVGPEPITDLDVAALEPRPDRDLADATAVATATLSAFGIEQHATIPPMEDQRPVEPQSPEHYERTWLEGRECWEERGCDWMVTFQELTKEYGLNIAITYEFHKDFRWVDMNADQSGALPRYAYIARSWTPQTYSSDNNKNHILQSYTLELWLPRDGGGFLWETHVLEEGEEAREVDSDGEGTLRLLSLWTESDMSLAVSEEIEVGTIRWGMNQNFKAVEAFLDEQFGQD